MLELHNADFESVGEEIELFGGKAEHAGKSQLLSALIKPGDDAFLVSWMCIFTSFFLPLIAVKL